MKLLRKRDILGERYTNAFHGYGPEDSHFVWSSLTGIGLILQQRWRESSKGKHPVYEVRPTKCAHMSSSGESLHSTEARYRRRLIRHIKHTSHLSPCASSELVSGRPARNVRVPASLSDSSGARSRGHLEFRINSGILVYVLYVISLVFRNEP